jgi:hypothetical protein
MDEGVGFARILHQSATLAAAACPWIARSSTFQSPPVAHLVSLQSPSEGFAS